MIKVTVNKSDLNRILTAIDRVGNVVAALALSIPEESAREFADILRNNITSQKYGDFGKPHKNWKKGQANESLYWLWLGTVLKSIKPWNIYTTKEVVKWFVGLMYTTGSPSGGVGESTSSTGAGTSVGTRTGKSVSGSGAPGTSGTAGRTIRKTTISTVKGRKSELSAKELRVKEILRKRAEERRTGHSEVRHIDPKGYVVQVRTTVGTQLIKGTNTSLGKEKRKKRVLANYQGDKE